MTAVITGGNETPRGAAALTRLVDSHFASRLFAGDASLWGESAAAEAAVRLGWTDFEDTAHELIDKTRELAVEFDEAGIDRIVLCGMGGSSLAPLVIAPNLTVLDSTHPETVRAALEGDLSRTAVVVSSKSGGTVETLSHRAAFEAAFLGAGIDPSTRIVVVTDPGSELERLANESGQRVFRADPHVGGRFSALTAFGIVPSVLAGADMTQLVRAAAGARAALMGDAADNPALMLAAKLAANLPDGFVLEMHPDGTLPEEFGLWVEQLVAESTGKDGQGLLPIALPLGAPLTQSPVVVPIHVGTGGGVAPGIRVAGELGEQFILWETATAALGFLLGVNPFNQPDVEAAKEAARESLGSPVSVPEMPAEELRRRLGEHATGCSYIAMQAYVPLGDRETADLLERVRRALSAEFGVAVAMGYGPRYLHSTGQFHKGGAGRAMFVQLVGTSARDVAIPGAEQGFGEFMIAQAQGDASVLRARGREVVSVQTPDPKQYLREVLAATGELP